MLDHTNFPAISDLLQLSRNRPVLRAGTTYRLASNGGPPPPRQGGRRHADKPRLRQVAHTLDGFGLHRAAPQGDVEGLEQHVAQLARVEQVVEPQTLRRTV